MVTAKPAMESDPRQSCFTLPPVKGKLAGWHRRSCHSGLLADGEAEADNAGESTNQPFEKILEFAVTRCEKGYWVGVSALLTETTLDALRNFMASAREYVSDIYVSRSRPSGRGRSRFRRRYRTLRIPATVVLRVHRQLRAAG